METPKEKARRRFGEIVSGEDRDINLGEAALLIAAHEYSHLDVGFYLGELDAYGARGRTLINVEVNDIEVILAFNSFFFKRLRFSGDTENYYDPRNSFLNDVIDRKKGIPITLSVVYMEVARRIGFTIDGVGMPMQFLVKRSRRSGDIFIDTFNNGRVMTEGECGDLLAKVSDGRIEVKPEHLAVVTKKQILTRMLSNLQGIYMRRGDHVRALEAVELSLIVDPNSALHVRDRGLLRAAMGQTSKALEDLETYLAFAPDEYDSHRIREQIGYLRRSQARLN